METVPPSTESAARPPTAARGLRLRIQLLALVLAVAVPLLGLLGASLYRSAQDHMRRTQLAALDLAALGAAQIEGTLDNARTVLTVLAERQRLRAGEPLRCDPGLTDLLRFNARFANVVLADTTGRVVCSAAVMPPGAELAGDREWFQKAAAVDTVVIGRPIIGRVSGRWVSLVAVRLRDDAGRHQAVLAVALDLARLQRVLESATASPGSTITVVDDEGVVVARSLESAQWVGKAMPQVAIIDFVLSHDRGTAKGPGVDGVERLWGYAPVGWSGWRVMAGVPTTSVLGPNLRRAGLQLGLGTGALLFMVGLALWFIRRVEGPLLEIGASADAVAAGRLDQRVPEIGGAELRDLARRFNEMVARRAQAEQELRQSRERLQELAARVEGAREAERARVAREIHDELGQALTGLKMDLVWLQRRVASGDAELAGRATEMSQLIDRTADATRRIAAELRPGVLDDLGLPAALQWLARDFEKRSGIPVRLETPEVAGAVVGEAATAVFRIVQEALTNVARHAGARTVVVAVTATKTHLVVTVRDDGRGMPESETLGERTFGILGMMERARTWGGEVWLESAPGRGTTVQVNIPLAGERR